MTDSAALLPGTGSRFYRLTATGRGRLGEEVASWNRLAEAIAIALRATPQEI